MPAVVFPHYGRLGSAHRDSRVREGRAWRRHRGGRDPNARGERGPAREARRCRGQAGREAPAPCPVGGSASRGLTRPALVVPQRGTISREPGELAGGRGGRAYLVVLAVGVAAAAVRRDAAPAVEHVARVALAALHAVVVAVALEADGGAARLAHAHAALVVAVGRAGDGCNTRRTHPSGLAPAAAASGAGGGAARRGVRAQPLPRPLCFREASLRLPPA